MKAVQGIAAIGLVLGLGLAAAAPAAASGPRSVGQDIRAAARHR